MTAATDIGVRRARMDDAPGLRALLHETYEATWLPNVTLEAAQAFRREDRPAAYVASHGLDVWVAEVGDEVAGLVHWAENFVHALHVRPSRQRMGVGHRLMDVAETDIRAAGFADVRLETDTFNMPSRAFYAGRGYIEADRFPDTQWSSGVTTLLLIKRISQD